MDCDYDSLYHSRHVYGSNVSDMDTTRMGSNIYHRWESVVPFELAMERLYTTVAESVGFFKELDSSFEEETKTIRPYATAAVMEELWKCKAAVADSGLPEKQDKHLPSYSRHRSNSCRTWLKRERDVPGKKDYHAQPVAAARTSFNVYLQRIDNDLLDALYCRWPSEQLDGGERTLSCVDVDGLHRLHEKLWVQDQALRRIASKVYRLRSCLKEVIKECYMLLIYMEKTKALWQPQKKGEGAEPVFIGL